MTRRRRRHRRYKMGKKRLRKQMKVHRRANLDILAAGRRFERFVFRGVPGRMDGWGYP